MGIKKCWVLFLLFFINCSVLRATEYKESVKILPAEANAYDVERLLTLASKYHYSDLDMALAYANLALEKTTDYKILAEIHRKIGLFHESHNLIDEATMHYQMELSYAKRSGDPLTEIASYTDLAIVSRREAKYKLCKDYHLKALELAETQESTNALETTYHGLGSLYKDVGDYEMAVQYYLKAIVLTEQRGDIPNVINTKQFVANTYAESRNIELALNTIEEAYQESLEVEDSLLTGIVLFDYGKILNIAEQYDEALPKLKESLDIFTGLTHRPLMARSLFYIADNYAQQDKYELANDFFQQCNELESYLSLRSYVDLQYKIGTLNWKKRDFEKAESAYQKSLILAQKNGFLDFSQKNNYGLYEIYNEKSEPAEALNYLKTSVILQDSIRNEEKSKKIAELQFKFDVEKGEREIQELQLKQNRLTLVGLSILFSLLIIFLGVIANQRGKNNESLKNKNEEIQKQNIKLRESNEVLQQFTYVAAHDLKEPLRSIGSFINLIQMKYGKNLNEEANEYMTFVTSSVKRMNNLLTSLLEYSTISIQKASDERINVKEILDEVSDNLHDKVAKKNANIQYKDHLPSLKMNPLHITQLFQNLVSNGIKFTDRAPLIKIEGIEDEEQVLFTVQDNGIGMEEDYADKVYNLFHQLNKNEGYEGTGIGLTICKNIVDKYDGKIWFESIIGEGTKFYLSFPKTV